MAFHSLFRRKMIVLPNSHSITYTFLHKRFGECTFRTWKWKGLPFHYQVQKVNILIEVLIIDSTINFHLSEAMKSQVLHTVWYNILVRLQEKFEIYHSWEWISLRHGSGAIIVKLVHESLQMQPIELKWPHFTFPSKDKVEGRGKMAFAQVLCLYCIRPIVSRDDGVMVPLGKSKETGVTNPNGYTLQYNGEAV